MFDVVTMSKSSDRERKIVRDLPNITSARQEESMRDFRDLVGFHNREIFRLGLCDGHKCYHHKVKSGTHQTTCYCGRSLNSNNPDEKKFWDKNHFENCSNARSMEKNLGCRGYEPADRFIGREGLPLYTQKAQGRKVI